MRKKDLSRSNRSRRGFVRGLLAEQLEDRRCMAGNVMDVNVDGIVSPLDALIVIQAINAQSGISGGTAMAGEGEENLNCDTNQDGVVTAQDVLVVVNEINTGDSTTDVTDPSDTPPVTDSPTDSPTTSTPIDNTPADTPNETPTDSDPSEDPTSGDTPPEDTPPEDTPSDSVPNETTPDETTPDDNTPDETDPVPDDSTDDDSTDDDTDEDDTDDNADDDESDRDCPHGQPPTSGDAPNDTSGDGHRHGRGHRDPHDDAINPLPEGTRLRDYMIERIEELFEELDEDASGAITENDVTARQWAVLSLFDVTDDDEVSVEELLALIPPPRPPFHFHH